LYLAGTDLPDDDYTTIVPPLQQTNSTHRKLPNVPTIIENKENDSPLTKCIDNKKQNLIKIFSFFMIVVKKSNQNFDRRKTTVTGISRRRPTIDYNSIEHAQSAPSSPNLARQRSNNNHIAMDQIDVVRIKKYIC